MFDSFNESVMKVPMYGVVVYVRVTGYIVWWVGLHLWEKVGDKTYPTTGPLSPDSLPTVHYSSVVI